MPRLPLAAAAALLAFTAGPLAAGPLRYKLHLAVPMQTEGGARLSPGEYDVVFEPAPAGGTAFTASYFLAGRLVATAPAVLEGAPPGTKLADIKVPPGARGAVKPAPHQRRDGAIHTCDYDANIMGTLAFFHALLTEIEFPAADASTKAPQRIALAPGAPVPAAARVTPTRTPTPAKK